MYQYELHCHTAGVSKCAHASPEEGAQIYIEAGYSGVVVTNHFNKYTFEDLPEGTAWDQVIDYYLSGWQRFRDAAGVRHGGQARHAWHHLEVDAANRLDGRVRLVKVSDEDRGRIHRA